MSKPSRELSTFPNPNPERDYEIAFEAPEFTCLCPMTAQPDFATIRIRYVPDQKCVELKSLKLYLWSYRDEGTFHEAVTNKIANDLIAALAPRYLYVEGDFYVRGGIKTVVKVEHRKCPSAQTRVSVPHRSCFLRVSALWQGQCGTDTLVCAFARCRS